jgi:phosphohistidine phosphatase
MSAVRLYLVRHAIAAERGREWPDDSKRPLIRKGVERMREVVRGLAELDVHVDVLLTSPFVRAVQTAEIVADGLTPRPSIVETSSLTPDEAPTSILRALEPYRRTKAVALVGHEPGIGRLAAWLLSAAEPVEFKKGGVCCIEHPALPPDGRGRLIWHATPAMLRALAE